MNYAVGKSPSCVQAIYSTIFKIKHKNLVVIFVKSLNLSTVPSRIPVRPFKIFLRPKNIYKRTTCVKKLGESPLSCNFAGSFVFLSDLQTFSVNSFRPPFENFAPSFSFLIGLITLSSKTFKRDFSSCSFSLVSNMANTL